MKIILCDYGCEQPGIYKMISGKYCCESHYNKCPSKRKRASENIKKAWTYKRKEDHSKRMKKFWKDPDHIFNSEKWKDKNSEGVKRAWRNEESLYNNEEFKRNRSRSNSGINNPMYGKEGANRYTMSMLLNKHPFFCKVESVRERKGKIQVRCKKCDEWFAPSGSQMTERIRQLEKESGNDRSYLYCSDKCKGYCDIFGKKYNEFLKKDDENYYTQGEYQVFRLFILERDNYKCQFCGEKATDVHHERPQKLEPFFALDPDFAWSCCKKCHYEKGHPADSKCSTGSLANKIC